MDSQLTQKEVDDAFYRGSVGKHIDLWLSITDRYKNEASRPIVGLGDLVLPVLIELYQWGFPITYVCNTYEGVVEAKKVGEQQSGMFNDILYMDFLHNCPRTSIIISIGIAEHLPLKDLYRWLDVLVRRGNEVYLPLPINGKDWYGLLKHKYDTVISKYRNGENYLAIIRRKYVAKQREEKNSYTRSKIKVVEKKSRKDKGGKKKLRTKIINGKS